MVKGDGTIRVDKELIELRNEFEKVYELNGRQATRKIAQMAREYQRLNQKLKQKIKKDIKF